MKFNKIVTIGIPQSDLDLKYWKKIDKMGRQRISLTEDNHEIYKHLANTDCLLVRFNKVEKTMIDHASHLKYIGVLATGFGGIDVGYAKSKKITICNVPGYSTESVAEFVFAVILEQLRDLERAKRYARKLKYSEAGFSATEIKNKIFGILGLGRIGTRVAEIALGFGADVRYWSKNRKKELEEKGIRYENADDLISKCDFLSLHFSKTEGTENFLNKKRFTKIKKGAIIINTAPMELVDIDALEKKLKNQNITFILDHSDEMAEKDIKRLLMYKNCIIYPPIAYISKEAKQAKQEIFVNNIESFLNGKSINTVS